MTNSEKILWRTKHFDDSEEVKNAEKELILQKRIKIVQRFSDNKSALNDQNYAKEAARILKAENFGPKNQWIVNKDLENDNI